MRRRGLILVGLALALPPAALAAFPQDSPNDPLFDASPLPNYANEQWDLASPGSGFDRGISVDRAWKLTTGKGATVADIDVGVDPQQPDLKGRLMRGYDFYADDRDPTSDTENSHGTSVAGVLGARADNGYGIAGIAPGARIMPLRTSDNILHQGVRLAEALVYAADHGADVASMSLGADSFGSQLRRAVHYAYRKGVVIAVASGNEFHFHHHYPQVEDDVLAVGGVNPDTADLRDKDPSLAPLANDFTVHASYADYGPHLDLVAPTQVPTITWGGATDLKWSGTSAATPHVAGAATLVAARGRQLGLHLSAGEIIQILRMSADDLTDPARGYAPGWDLLSGWGRVNAFAAVSRVKRGKIPPVPDINAPGWYQPATGKIRVTGAIKARSLSRWTLLIGRGQQPDRWRKIGGGLAIIGMPPVLSDLDARRMAPGGYTLLLRARDENGNVGEDRDFFYVVDRRQQRLHHGFPKFLGTSGEASPALADLNGDGAKDIVLATADGLLRVYDGRSGQMLRGWPQKMRPARGSHEAARHIGTVRSGFVGSPAIGDVAGGRAPEVVATGMDGRLYVWSARGEPVHGFPYRIKLHHPSEKGQLDSAIYSSPALADLTGNRKLEIIFGAADQRVYAVRGNGKDAPGWPVLARDGDSIAKILSSPAVGDLDGDHSPDVVIGTGEAYGSTPSTSGRVYAFTSHGKLLPGWPVEPSALAANSIPLAGQGVPDSPSLADVDGDGADEVAVAAFTGQPELYDGDGTRLSGAGGQSRFQVLGRGAASPASAPAVIALGASGAFGRLSQGGQLGFFGGAVDFRLAQAQLSPATRTPFEHLLGGWDAQSGSWLSSFPIPTEGWEILTSPAVADVDGDGQAEVINGTSGNVLHAFSADGSEPPGWPKNAGGWLLASPAVGDVDGDRRLEVVDVTRDGYLFIWDTPTRVRSRALQWPSFRHDRHNSGNYGR